MRLVKLATCSLNQWAMDFDGNLSRIQKSIAIAKAEGAKYRVGPELEITGYGCEDHFLELDTCEHAWECLASILSSDLTDGILCDIGLPVIHKGARYNCRAFCLDRRLLLLRPKKWLANDGNYRELRWFTGWKQDALETHPLPSCIADICGQESVPIGDAVLALRDTTLGCETCEELFTPASPHIRLALNGVEIVSNSSGSHHQLRKLDTRLELMRGASAKAGGVYLYSNQKGCDGGRLYYDGCSSILVNGDVVAQGTQFSLTDVEVVPATVDLDTVVAMRTAVSSMMEQASGAERIPTIRVPFSLADPSPPFTLFATLPQKVRYHLPEEEMGLGPACWMWDYLRRSKATGFLLPLSGGADSSSVAAMVASMTQLVVQAIEAGDETVAADAVRIGGYGEGEVPVKAEEFAHRLLHTVYMGTENSSEATRGRAAKLASQIGSSHLPINIDAVVSAVIALFATVTGRRPLFKVDGGSSAENLALQNIQARLRMVCAFLFAQLLPWVRGRHGFLLVLGSANVDEGLRGYLTKYDCSSADINPIGGISKTDLRAFLKWGALHLGLPVLAEIEAAPPTAELEPIRTDYTQSDEVDMGMTYEELSLYGRLRKIFRCGPVSMFRHLVHRWHGRYRPAEVAVKVKTFFTAYSANRHKMTTITPAYHAENYSPEDNRFDLRQFLYNTSWPWQYRKIDELVASAGREEGKCDAETVTSAEAERGGTESQGVPAVAAGNPHSGK